MTSDHDTTADAGTATATGTLPLRPGRWQIDPAHSSIAFAIRHLGLSKVRGSFEDVEAWLDVGDGPDDTRVTATVRTASVHTGNADRDGHLRAPDFLAVEQHPEMTFTSTAISGASSDWQMAGDLTLLGRTHHLELDVEFHGVETFVMDGLAHAGFGAVGKLRRHDLGLSFQPPPGGGLVLGDVVTFELDLQFVEPATG